MSDGNGMKEFLVEGTKEFLVDGGCTYENRALARLFEMMVIYLKIHEHKPWKWRKEPETQQADNGEWKAYARIEFL